MTKDLGIVLVSGGMDSLVTLAIAREHHRQLAILHLNYGQKTSRREQESFQDIASHYNVPKELQKIIAMDFLSQIGGSSLTDQTLEVAKYRGDSDEIPDSYVPFRNSIILSLAVSWAEVLSASDLYIGANEEDSPGYPDCRPVYYQAFQKVIELGSKEGKLKIHTPVISMKKKDIVLAGQQRNVPFEKTWSCYAQSDVACGICDSCALRLRGFREAGIQDPIRYNDKV